MMSPAPSSAGLALARLRRAVSFGCWIIGLALVVQLVIWSLASFTDLRFEEVAEENGDAPLIVEAAPRENSRSRSNGLPLPSHSNVENDEKDLTNEQPTDEYGRVLSSNDRQFATTYNLAGGVGRTVSLIVVMLVATGLMLGIAASAAGIEKGVSAFIMIILLSIFVLPAGALLGLPWTDGALSKYEYMTDRADQISALHDTRLRENDESEAAQASDTTESDATATAAATSDAGGMVIFLARFGAFPVTCVVLVTIAGLRFAASIEAAAQSEESMRLDPAIEREASNITPTSLHSVRGTGFSRAIAGKDGGYANQYNGHGGGEENGRSIRQPSPGEAPKRLI